MPVYLDSAATTPADERVVAVIERTLRETGGNPASHHRAGVAAAAVVERARARLAAALGAAPDEVVFTGGGSEANNLALKGLVFGRGLGAPAHLVTSAVEHASVRETARWLQTLGCAWTALPVDGDGCVDPDAVARAIRPDTVLVSIVHGNNEIGTIQPLAAIARVCRERGVPFHADACQSFTRAPLRLGGAGRNGGADAPSDEGPGPDLVTVNAHKIHGPKGVGALLVGRGTPLAPLVHGGGQEGGLRSGTLAVPAIAGFAAALECADPGEPTAVAALRDRFVAAVLDGVPGARRNGPADGRGLCHIASLTLPGVSAKRLTQALSRRGVYLSAGSACAAGKAEASPVLLAIGLDAAAAAETVRASFHRGLTAAEVDQAAAELCAAAREERGLGHAAAG